MPAFEPICSGGNEVYVDVLRRVVGSRIDDPGGNFVWLQDRALPHTSKHVQGFLGQFFANFTLALLTSKQSRPSGIMECGATWKDTPVVLRRRRWNSRSSWRGPKWQRKTSSRLGSLLSGDTSVLWKIKEAVLSKKRGECPKNFVSKLQVNRFWGNDWVNCDYNNM